MGDEAWSFSVSYPCSINFSGIKEGYSTVDTRIKCSFSRLQFPIWYFFQSVHSYQKAAIPMFCNEKY